MNRSMLLGALAALTIGVPAYAQYTQQSISVNDIGSTAVGLKALTTDIAADNSSSDCSNGSCNETAVGNFALAEDSGGSYNSALGTHALRSLTSGAYDSALGAYAMYSATTGSSNVAVGYQSLYANQTGGSNTAIGTDALQNATGFNNTGVGAVALNSLTSGQYNTGVGALALYYNLTGNYNTALGFEAVSGTSGPTLAASYNTGVGSLALNALTTGNYNTASGYEALHADTAGIQNTANGGEAMFHNTKGNYNTAVGMNALTGNTTGSMNTAIGYKAGLALTTGSNNIDIGSQGVAAESDVIRIGSASQTATYVAGIHNNTSTDNTFLPVVVNSAGRLGVASQSSERFKTDIAPMGSSTTKLEELRPVRFHFKHDTNGTQYYGLIAEEVAKVYPELVVHGPNGRIDGVRYDELAPMLLNEMKLQKQQLYAQANEIRDLKAAVQALQGSQRN